MPQLNVRQRNEETVVAICDSELLGEEFEDEDFKLKVNREFYEGKEVTVEECLEALEKATIANLVGSIIKHAIEAGYINSERVLEIDGIPHAQMATP